MSSPRITYGTPRKLPKPGTLAGRVLVLDVAFAGVSGGGFEEVTGKFLKGLGDRLAGWVDHHDHERHAHYAEDPRFLLRRKAEHGACPELITPELVERIGPIDTIVCHNDFDGLVSAAKWLCGGREPYEGADADARAIDTRMGQPSELAVQMDRALRARPGSIEVQDCVIAYLRQGCPGGPLQERLASFAAELIPIERETARAAAAYRVYPRRGGGSAAYVEIERGFGRVDKTELLLKGQALAQVSIVVDANSVSVAAAFDSGLDFLSLFSLAGGMPTRVSLARKELDFACERLGIDFVA